MNKQTKTNNKLALESAAVCAVSGKLVPEKNGRTYSRPQKEQAEAGGKFDRSKMAGRIAYQKSIFNG